MTGARNCFLINENGVLRKKKANYFQTDTVVLNGAISGYGSVFPSR